MLGSPDGSRSWQNIGGLIAALVLGISSVFGAFPRVWIADQGDNQGVNNRILEIDPVNRKVPPDSEGDAIALDTLPSPAVTFLDELTLDDQQRMWCVVKDSPSQEPDGAKLINPLLNPSAVLRTIRPVFPNESLGGILEGISFDGTGLWISAVRAGLTGNMLTRVSPLTGARIAPFDSGSPGTTGKVSIPGNVAQGLLYEPPSAGRTHGYLWHSDVNARRIWKLDVSLLFDGDPGNDNHLAVAEFQVPFGPKGMDWMNDKIWTASPHDGIWEFDPATGATSKLFNTPLWNLDGVAILNPQGPVILVSPHELAPAAWIGSDAGSHCFTIRNGGLGTMAYTISVNENWLEAAPLAGSCGSEEDLIGVSYQTSSLLAGLYEAAITVVGPEAGNSPQIIKVRLAVQTVGPDLDGDSDVDQEDFGVMQTCFSGEGVPPSTGCEPADFQGDGDVDGSDFQLFMACCTGPGRPAIQDCDTAR